MTEYPPTSTGSTASDVGPQPRITIVDGDDSVRQAVERLCASAGYHVTSYDSAEALLDALRSDVTDCLIVELDPPGMRSLEFQSQLLAINDSIPIVMMITGREDEKSRSRALENGAIAFLRKPFHVDRLLAAIKKALSGCAQEDWLEQIQ